MSGFHCIYITVDNIFWLGNAKVIKSGTMIYLHGLIISVKKYSKKLQNYADISMFYSVFMYLLGKFGFSWVYNLLYLSTIPTKFTKLLWNNQSDIKKTQNWHFIAFLCAFHLVKYKKKKLKLIFFNCQDFIIY